MDLLRPVVKEKANMPKFTIDSKGRAHIDYGDSPDSKRRRIEVRPIFDTKYLYVPTCNITDTKQPVYKALPFKPKEPAQLALQDVDVPVKLSQEAREARRAEIRNQHLQHVQNVIALRGPRHGLRRGNDVEEVAARSETTSSSQAKAKNLTTAELLESIGISPGWVGLYNLRLEMQQEDDEARAYGPSKSMIWEDGEIKQPRPK